MMSENFKDLIKILRKPGSARKTVGSIDNGGSKICETDGGTFE